MLLPELPDALIVRRNAHGFSHSFTALQMDKYGRDCAEAALEHAASACEAQAEQLTYPSTGNAIALVCAAKIRGAK